MLYFPYLMNALICESVLLLHTGGTSRVKLQLNNDTQLAVRDQEERKATKFVLGNQKKNLSTYEQNVIK